MWIKFIFLRYEYNTDYTRIPTVMLSQSNWYLLCGCPWFVLSGALLSGFGSRRATSFYPIISNNERRPRRPEQTLSKPWTNSLDGYALFDDKEYEYAWTLNPFFSDLGAINHKRSRLHFAAEEVLAGWNHLIIYDNYLGDVTRRGRQTMPLVVTVTSTVTAKVTAE